LTETSPVEIKLTPEFQRAIRLLAKRYRKIRLDLAETLQQLQTGNFLGDQIQGIGYPVLKVRIKNTDSQRGKSGGYRLIYWIQSPASVVLLDIYSKSDQENADADEIQRIVKDFQNQ
jgi:mRNA-degrading endonuclease RelE of RelBE toxin-antitoxin system